MDVAINYGSTRYGVDYGFFSFLGIGEGKKQIGKWRSQQAAELSKNNPYANNANDQSLLVQKHEAILDGLKQERARAKSVKTKNSLDARIQAYNEWLADAKYYLSQLEKQAIVTPASGTLGTLTSGGQVYNVEPAPIVTSVGGQVELPTKQVLIQETPTPIAQDLTLSRSGDVVNEGLVQPTQPSNAKKDNTLLYVGLGLAAVAVVFLIAKK